MLKYSYSRLVARTLVSAASRLISTLAFELPSLAVIVLAFTPSVFAQSNTGAITGTVFDQSQAVMNSVKITATNLGTNVAQTATTNADGIYSIPALVPGAYRLTLEKSGFKKLIREPITVEGSGTVALDFNLTVGSTATEVLVNADAPLVQQASSTIQYGVDLKQIDELPLANQSALQILNLLPGVQGQARTEQAAITTGFTTPGGGLSISGSAMGTVQFQADGVNNTSLYYGRIGLSFSTDAVAEVTVAQNSYSAEYRAAGGAIVNMTTKSGTNQFHGTVFSFTQNDILNASPWLTYRQKGPVRYWRGGVDVGGPVVIPKDLQRQKSHLLLFRIRAAATVHAVAILRQDGHRGRAPRRLFEIRLQQYFVPAHRNLPALRPRHAQADRGSRQHRVPAISRQHYSRLADLPDRSKDSELPADAQYAHQRAGRKLRRLSQRPQYR